MQRHSNFSLLSLLFVSLAMLALGNIKAHAQDATVVIPRFPQSGETKDSLQLRTFGFITITPTPKPTTKPPPPAAAPIVSPSTGGGKLVSPPNMKGCRPDNYCQMPESTNGSYKFVTCNGATGKRWGAKELVDVLHTVAKNWKAKYPQGFLYLSDMTAGNHKTHFWGIAVDLYATTNGKDFAANMTRGNYNRQATIELGKMIVDTGLMDTIWYNDTPANAAIFSYAKSKYPAVFTTNTSGKPGIRPVSGHEDHFHLNIRIPKLAHKNATCSNFP